MTVRVIVKKLLNTYESVTALIAGNKEGEQVVRNEKGSKKGSKEGVKETLLSELVGGDVIF